jgi:hypothetical protein
MAKKVTDDGTTSADGGTVSEASVAETAMETDSETGTEVETATAETSGSVDPETFDPVGTLALILLYFAILVVAWVVMYFVEFLGNGPTVVG